MLRWLHGREEEGHLGINRNILLMSVYRRSVRSAGNYSLLGILQGNKQKWILSSLEAQKRKELIKRESIDLIGMTGIVS